MNADLSSEIFFVIKATDITGAEVALVIGHSDQMVEDGAPPIKKLTYKIIDVSGDRDGANCEVKMEWFRKISPNQREVARIRETPEQLRAVFADANVTMPRVARSIRGRFRDMGQKIFQCELFRAPV